MNSKAKGDIAVGKCIAYYLGKDIEVLLPIGDKRPYDLVVEEEHRLKKVQCKYTSHKNRQGRYTVDLRTTGSHNYKTKLYKSGDFDILFVTTEELKQYEIPYEAISKIKTTFSLTDMFDKYII